MVVFAPGGESNIFISQTTLFYYISDSVELIGMLGVTPRPFGVEDPKLQRKITRWYKSGKMAHLWWDGSGFTMGTLVN